MTESLAPTVRQGGEAEDSNSNSNSNSSNTRPQPTTRPTIPTNNRSTGTFSGPHSLAVSRSPSTVASPRSSRDSSPAGRPLRQQTTSSAASSGMPSRKDSHDVSPHRPACVTAHSGTIPSAAAIQRALSAATTPQLPIAPTSDPSSTTTSTSKLPRVSRVQATTTGSGENTPTWPLSPRLKSPPPSSSRKNSLRTPRKPEISTVTPNIIVQNSTPTSTSGTPLPKQAEAPEEPDARAGASAGKAPSRGASGAPTLETVQESSAPTTPGDTPASEISSTESPFVDAQSEDGHEDTSGTTTPRERKANVSKGDSGSDTGAEKKNDRQNKDAEEQDPDTTPRAKAVVARASVSSLKPKAEASAKNMTVETETISSIPQGTLGPPADRIASGRIEHGGTLRPKASSDTIRPNKGRKKASRKAPSINNTSASTRADIFEDRVKNAMEDATSDDSDETFVYESNPPEPTPARRSRHHSRTPSGASAISNTDQRGLLRLNQSVLSTQKTRSMKFTNAYNSGDEESVDRGGTIRASAARGGSSSVHHHHLSRPGRNGTGHTSILDEDNGVFHNNLSKVPSLTGLSRQVPRLNNRHLQAANGSGRREAGYVSYDVDADGGDDEGTPLIGTGTVRTPRGTKRSSPLQASRPPQYLDHYPSGAKSIFRRCAGCIVMLVMILLMIFGVVAFLFAISTPLSNVCMVEIQAVLASEQELMFDIVVESENPNLLPITIADTDFSVFARSKYVGSEKWWREHGDESMPPLEPIRRKSTDDVRGESWWNPKPKDKEPWNPFPEPDDTEDHEGLRPTMVLGRIYKLETPLSFDGSFWKKHKHVSTATLRLLKPGNSTEMGGTARWERVLLHPFDLIVRGSLKYNIPLGGHSYAVAVSNEVTIHPEEGDKLPVEPEDGIVKISRSLDRYRESTALTSTRSEQSSIIAPIHGFASRVKSTLFRAILEW
ncbi:hypothetical protein E2P81_ATG12104 [Venturia nashicola]|nr:hypothetical protein E2P81_ATG12104 [Venturia nashicola]